MQLTENTLFDRDRYRLIRFLGQGGFSQVWLVKDTVAGITVVLKVYAPGKGLDEDGVKLFSDEFRLAFDLNHKNLLHSSHFGICDRMPYLIMPYCERGSTKKMAGKMSEDEAWKFMRDVASGLDYLHSQETPVVHQDIKPDNVLVHANGDYLITDFGVSTKIRSTLRQSLPRNSSGGTLDYMGPERFGKDNQPIKASDIWALGATMFELLTGDVPFVRDGGLTQKIGADIPEIRGNYSDELKSCVYKCLALNAWDRPVAGQLVQWAERRSMDEPETKRKFFKWKSKSPKPDPKPFKPDPEPERFESNAYQRNSDPEPFIPEPEPEPFKPDPELFKPEPEQVTPEPEYDDSEQNISTSPEHSGKRRSIWRIAAAVIILAMAGAFAVFLNQGKKTETVVLSEPDPPENIVVDKNEDKPVVDTREKEYSEAFERAETLFRSGDYKAAKTAYENLRASIPASDTGGKSDSVNARINDCNKNIKEEEDKKAKEKEEKERKTQERKNQIAQALQQADAAFGDKRFDTAFNLYKKAKDLGGDASEGYSKFFSLAELLIGLKGSEKDIVKHLQYAQQLNNTPQVRNLLKNYN